MTRGSMLLVLAALAAWGPATGLAAGPDFRTDQQKLDYQWGTAIADELANVGATDPAELEWIFRGMRDRVAGKSPPFSQEEGTRLTSYLLERIRQNGVAEQARAATYLAAKAKEPGVVVSASGLVYREVRAGKGASPKKDSSVKVEYTGRLRNGWVFDSSGQRGGPFQGPLTGVIPCWQEALTRMKTGGKAVITCPPALGYGDGGTYNIPPGSALTFEVELLDVSAAKASAP